MVEKSYDTIEGYHKVDYLSGIEIGLFLKSCCFSESFSSMQVLVFYFMQIIITPLMCLWMGQESPDSSTSSVQYTKMQVVGI